MDGRIKIEARERGKTDPIEVAIRRQIVACSAFLTSSPIGRHVSAGFIYIVLKYSGRIAKEVTLEAVEYERKPEFEFIAVAVRVDGGESMQGKGPRKTHCCAGRRAPCRGGAAGPGPASGATR